MTYKFFIPGVPVAKKRPRFVRVTGHAYDPNVTESGEAMLYLINTSNQDGFEKLSGPCAVNMVFVFARPKSHWRTGKFSGYLKDSAPTYADKIVKDCDNMEKFYLDAMNNVVFDDDKQVVILGSEKIFQLPGSVILPGTYIRVSTKINHKGAWWWKK